MDVRKRGTMVDLIVNIFIPDNTVTTGAGVTGLTNASTNLGVAVRRELSASETTYTGANLEAQTTIGTYQAPSSSAKCRIKETQNAGQYELQFHVDAGHFGTGDASKKVFVRVYEASTTALKIGPNTKEIQLVLFDLEVATQKVDVDTIKTNPVVNGGTITFPTNKTLAAPGDAMDATQINGSATAAANLALGALSMLAGTVDNTALAPTTTEFEADDITEATANHYHDRIVVFTSGDLIRQVAQIQAYSLVGGRGHFTVSALTEAPANNDTFLII